MADRIPAMAATLCLALRLCASEASEDWEYRQGIGFVNASTMERRSPQEFLDHALGLRHDGAFEEALRAFGLILNHVPEPELRERAHYERAETRFRAGSFFEAYHDFEAFVSHFPQSAHATNARRREMEAALQLARGGHMERIFGIPLFSSSKTGMGLLGEALRRYPREDFSAFFYHEMGMFYHERSNLDAAEVEFTTVVEQYPDSPMYVLSLYMLARCREHRFNDVPYDVKPLREARRHYERFIEEAGRMRRLPPPAPDWVAPQMDLVRQRLARVDELMAEKEIRTARYYAWKGYPNSAAVSYRTIARYYPDTPAAQEARSWLRERGLPLPVPFSRSRAAEPNR